MLFCGFARFFERAGGVFVCLAREFVGSEASLTMGGCGSGVRVGGKVVVFRSAIVWALGH